MAKGVIDMTPQSKLLVQETWQRVAPIADTAASLFYGRLFELDPSLKRLFDKTDIYKQSNLLMQMLGAAVKGLDNLEQLLPVMEQLGQRHVGYGVQDSHYDTVGSALLWTLDQGLGEGFTPAVRDAWAEAYGVLSGVMKEAARQDGDGWALPGKERLS
jgi:hemoglobin-like flavoprotein